MNSAGATYVNKGHTLAYLLQQFWGHEYEAAHYCDLDPKSQPLPLARIKKVMKSDREVKMISSEAPILFAKACEIFISEITIRAWQHAEENRRRTLQRSDVAAALARSDQFDFLIDLLPRDEFIRPEAHINVLHQQPLAYPSSQNVGFKSMAPVSNYQTTPIINTPAINAPVINASSSLTSAPGYKGAEFTEPPVSAPRQGAILSASGNPAQEHMVGLSSTGHNVQVSNAGAHLMSYLPEFN